jgi:hypothetical protein
MDEGKVAYPGFELKQVLASLWWCLGCAMRFSGPNSMGLELFSHRATSTHGLGVETKDITSSSFNPNYIHQI